MSEAGPELIMSCSINQDVQEHLALGPTVQDERLFSTRLYSANQVSNTVYDESNYQR